MHDRAGLALLPDLDMSPIVALTRIVHKYSAPVQWDEKQLVAALEGASLLDLQKVLAVHPIKAVSRKQDRSGLARRGRFMPVVEAVANIRLSGYVFRALLAPRASLALRWVKGCPWLFLSLFALLFPSPFC